MQGCHSRVARRLVGVGSQMASIRSASIGPFGSFTTSGEGLKLPVSEFHPILRQYSRCPFSGSRAQRIRKGRTAARPTSALAGPRSHAVTAAQETPRKLNGGQGRARPGLPRMRSLCIRPAERVRVSERRGYEPRHIRAITRMVARAESNHGHADFQKRRQSSTPAIPMKSLGQQAWRIATGAPSAGTRKTLECHRRLFPREGPRATSCQVARRGGPCSSGVRNRHRETWSSAGPPLSSERSSLDDYRSFSE